MRFTHILLGLGLCVLPGQLASQEAETSQERDSVLVRTPTVQKAKGGRATRSTRAAAPSVRMAMVKSKALTSASQAGKRIVVPAVTKARSRESGLADRQGPTPPVAHKTGKVLKTGSDRGLGGTSARPQVKKPAKTLTPASQSQDRRRLAPVRLETGKGLKTGSDRGLGGTPPRPHVKKSRKGEGKAGG